MVNPLLKNEIADAFKALDDQNPITRIEAINQLRNIGVSHPQIIKKIQAIMESGSSQDEYLAARDALDFLRIKQNGLPLDEPTINSESVIIELLHKQIELLTYIQNHFIYSLEKENERAYHIRSRIVDIDISIGSMMVLSFKWLIASIPVGLVIGILIFILGACVS